MPSAQRTGHGADPAQRFPGPALPPQARTSLRAGVGLRVQLDRQLLALLGKPAGLRQSLSHEMLERGRNDHLKFDGKANTMRNEPVEQ